MMQNLIDEDKLKKNEQNIWDTSVQYNKTYPFQNALNMTLLKSRNMHTRRLGESNMSVMRMNQV